MNELNHRIFLLCISLILLLSGCSTAIKHLEQYKNYENDYTPINAEIANKYALYAMMSANAYHDLEPFPLNILNWELVDLDGISTVNATFDEGCGIIDTGLAYDIYKQKSTNKVVFAFRGTDEIWCDFFKANTGVLFALQYEEAFNEIEKFLAKESINKDDVIVTGHSLGGGLAIAISIRYGIDAFVFDSSPVINSLSSSGIEPANRVLIFQKGEFLEVARIGSSTISTSQFKEAIPKESIYQTGFKFGVGIDPHSSRPLAMHLLKLGSTIEGTELKTVCTEIRCNIAN